MANQIDSIKKIDKELLNLTDTLKSIREEIVGISKDAREVSTALNNVKTPKDLSKEIKKTSDNTEQLNALLKEQDRTEKNLIATIAKKELATESTNRAVIKQRFELQQQNKLIKEATVISSRYSTLLQKTTAQRNKLARTIQDLNLKRELGNKLSNKEQKELRQSTKQFEKYDKAVKKAKNSVGRFQENVGNYPKILSSIKNVTTGLIGAFGVIEGLRLGVDFAKDAVRVAREAKGVEFAFQRLGIEGVQAFENIKKSTRGTLSDLDIKKSLNEFDNFNISLKQTDVLFEFLAVRAAQTGKSVDSLRDSLVEGLAKESKLRIDNLGISVKDLNEELEKAPDFVTAVANIAKTEIAEAGNILDEAASSQEKFNAAFENFKVSAGDGFLGRFTNGIYDLGTAFSETALDISDASKSMFEFAINSGLVLTGLGKVVEQRAEENREETKRADLIKEINDLQIKRGINEDTAYNLGNKLIQQRTEEIEQLAEIERRIAEAIKKREEEANAINDGTGAIKERNKVQAQSLKTVEEQSKELSKLPKIFNGLFKDDLKFELPEIDQGNISKVIEEINKKVAEDLKIQIAKDDIKEGLNDLANTIEDFTGVSGDKFLDFFDKITQKGVDSFEEIGDIAASAFSLASDVSNAFFQGRIEGYQQDIDANNEYYNNLLENENLSDDERERLEKDRRKKEERLKKEQAKEKKKQFEINKLFRIGEIIANTAVAVTEALPNIPLSVAVGVLGAAQLAIVASQPTPKFAEGGVMDHDGLMMINDHRSGRLEVVERDGKLLMTSERNALVEGKKGDIIHKDAKEYFNNLSDSDILKDVNNHAMMATLQNQNYLINKLDNKKVIDSERINTDRIIKAIKSQKTKFNLNQNISLAEDLRHLDRFNNTL